MKPLIHAEVSARRFGGKPEDYQKIHDWFDQTKAFIPDMRHRLVLHNSFGIFLCEQLFGTYIENSDGRKVSVRDVGEQHVIDDMGTIPTLNDCFVGTPLYDWLGGRSKQVRQTIPMVDQEKDIMTDIDVKATIAKLKALQEEHAKLAKETGVDLIKALCKNAFEANLDIEAFAWNQYTPHFNDGDACEFGLHGAAFKLFSQEVDEDDSIWEWGHDFDMSEKWLIKQEGRTEEGAQALVELYSFLGDNQNSILLPAFGDGVTVTVTREAINIKECYHD